MEPTEKQLPDIPETYRFEKWDRNNPIHMGAVKSIENNPNVRFADGGLYFPASEHAGGTTRLKTTPVMTQEDYQAHKAKKKVAAEKSAEEIKAKGKNAVIKPGQLPPGVKPKPKKKGYWEAGYEG